MPIDTAARRGDVAAIERVRERLETLLHKYAKQVAVAGENCLFWEKPLEGNWHPNWGGPPVTTLHNSDAWYAARVLVELYRYDRARNQAKPEYLRAGRRFKLSPGGQLHGTRHKPGIYLFGKGALRIPGTLLLRRCWPSCH